ncbi:MAG: hypothetical protein KBT63_10475 [Porticoccaceae bacterium]|nr:hypothetical protein [Porticoccaceae bacterium]
MSAGSLIKLSCNFFLPQSDSDGFIYSGLEKGFKVFVFSIKCSECNHISNIARLDRKGAYLNLIADQRFFLLLMTNLKVERNLAGGEVLKTSQGLRPKIYSLICERCEESYSIVYAVDENGASGYQIELLGVFKEALLIGGPERKIPKRVEF